LPRPELLTSFIRKKPRLFILQVSLRQDALIRLTHACFRPVFKLMQKMQKFSLNTVRSGTGIKMLGIDIKQGLNIQYVDMFNL
jgi:hypothetical protein